jgi:hypothetical protein
VALAVSDDGRRMFVANGKSRTVAIISLSGHAGATLIACGCTPTGLDRLAGGEVFRLTEPSDLPMWILEATRHQPRVLFVPAGSHGTAGSDHADHP